MEWKESLSEGDKMDDEYKEEKNHSSGSIDGGHQSFLTKIRSCLYSSL